MHTTLGSTVLALAALLACSGNDAAGPGPSDSTATGNPPTTNVTNAKILTAIINGAPFGASTVNAAFFNGQLTITGYSDDRILQINAINVEGPGVVSFAAGNQWKAIATVIDVPSTQYSSGNGGTGTITLTAVSTKRVTGSFTFTAYTTAGSGAGKPVASVINGVFDVTNR